MRKSNWQIWASAAFIFGIAGCDSASIKPVDELDVTPAEHVALAAGAYEIMAKYEGIAERRFDVIMFNDVQAQNWKQSYVPILISRLRPSYPTPSYSPSDYVCTTSDIVENGALFSTSGECNIPSFGETTTFQIEGKQLETNFWIKFIIHGPRVSEDGSDKTVIIRGHKVQ
jgi:hypothetical protein